MFIHKFWFKKKSNYTHPPFDNVVDFFLYVDYWMSKVHRKFTIFTFWFKPPNDIYLLIDILAFILILV